MPRYTLRDMGPPGPKQQKIMEHILAPDPDNIKKVDVCCGRGFGKSLFAIDLTTRILSISPKQIVLFLEPDHKRIQTVFLKKWLQHVPPELYTLNKTHRHIKWINGAQLFYSPRNITGAQSSTADSQLGQDVTAIIDDEAALKCNHDMYLNNVGTIRVPSPVRVYLTLSTPRVGAYRRLVTSPGHTLFRGTSYDNPYRPKNYVKQLSQGMTRDQIQREVFGHFISLDGQIWKTANYFPFAELTSDMDTITRERLYQQNKDTAWPHGNRHDEFAQYDPNKPYWLFCDLGGRNGAYIAVQKTYATYLGNELFPGPVWVAVADFCPDNDASASRAFQIFKREMGTPAGIVAGRDEAATDKYTGKTLSYFAKQIFGNVRIYPCDERFADRQVQHDVLSHLFGDAKNHRRFTVAKNFVKLFPDSKRSVPEMIIEDEWPDQEKQRQGDFLPKNRENRVQHVRDALLMGAVKIMADPMWIFKINPTG